MGLRLAGISEQGSASHSGMPAGIVPQNLCTWGVKGPGCCQVPTFFSWLLLCSLVWFPGADVILSVQLLRGGQQPGGLHPHGPRPGTTPHPIPVQPHLPDPHP